MGVNKFNVFKDILSPLLSTSEYERVLGEITNKKSVAIAKEVDLAMPNCEQTIWVEECACNWVTLQGNIITAKYTKDTDVKMLVGLGFDCMPHSNLYRLNLSLLAREMKLLRFEEILNSLVESSICQEIVSDLGDIGLYQDAILTPGIGCVKMWVDMRSKLYIGTLDYEQLALRNSTIYVETSKVCDNLEALGFEKTGFGYSLKL